MRDNHIRMLCNVIKIDLLYEDPSGVITPFFDSLNTSPLYQSAELRDNLRIGMMDNKGPYIMHDDFGAY